MAISVAQVCFRQQVYSQSFGSNVTTGNSLVIAISAFTTSGATISSSAPTFNGLPVTGAVLLEQQQSGGTNGVYCALWLLPFVTGGVGGPVAITVTNGGTAGAVGITCWEIAGLGASPSVDQVSAGDNTSGTTVASGATPAITTAPEFVAGIGCSFGNAMGGAGASWTEQAAGDGGTDTQSGYQVATSSGGTYNYSQTAAGSAAWAAVVATVKGTGGGTDTGAAALTVTPARSAAMTRTGFGAAAATVTPARSAAMVRTGFGAAALTVIPAFAAAMQHTALTGAALTVTPGFRAVLVDTTTASAASGTGVSDDDPARRMRRRWLRGF